MIVLRAETAIKTSVKKVYIQRSVKFALSLSINGC